MKNSYFVYILASKKNGTLYVGVTNNIERRSFEHSEKINNSFTKKYGVDKLVYYEETNDISNAIQREKRIKTWKRSWKIRLIEKMNPEWLDLRN